MNFKEDIMGNYKISVIIPAYNSEEFLPEALDSLLNQSFYNFEVIIVNDGSTDLTQNIIDEYCQNYSNFKSILQPHSGVSNARNKGIENAKGKYLAFLDADDLFTPTALENLYESAISNDAELVIGISGHFDAFGSNIHLNTVKLAKMEHIEPFEKQIIWSFSQSNKLFLRKKLVETGIRFDNLKYAEDGVFVLKYAYQCSRITGCPYEIVFFRNHDFWEGLSTTQKTDLEHITHYLAAYDLIFENATNYFNNKLNKTKTSIEKAKITVIYYNYLDAILYRKVSILLNEFYRYFWKTNNDSLELINDSISNIKKNVFPRTWLKLKKSFRDLNIDDLIYNRDLMAENPVMSIVLDLNEISKSDLELILNSIYAQDFPAFELLIHENLYKASSKILNAENLHTINPVNDSFKNCALNESKGKYVLFVNEPILFDPKTFKTFYYNIYDGFFDAVSVKINHLKNSLNLQDLVEKISEFNGSSHYDYLDLCLSNKLIKKDYLITKKFSFTGNNENIIKKIYQNAKFKNIDGNFIFGVENSDIPKFSITPLPKKLSIINYRGKLNKLIKQLNENKEFFKIGTNKMMMKKGFLVSILWIKTSINDRINEIKNIFS